MARHGLRTEAEKEKSSMNTSEKAAKKPAKKVAPAQVSNTGARDTFMAPKDPINPAHYRSHPSGVECIEVIEALPYNVGAAIKYLWRAGLKTADPLEDLEKARWHVNREIARLKKPIPYRLTAKAVAK